VNPFVLIVDDDRAFSTMAVALLQREGFSVQAARSLYEARRAIATRAPELVVLDRRLPDGDGLALLPELRQVPRVATLMVTAHGDVSSAVEAIRGGAADYLTKPVELADLVLRLKRALGDRTLRDRLETVEAALEGRHRFVPPASPAMRQVVEMLDRIAQTPRSPVLLLGPTGVGKEVLARRLHGRSTVGDAPFVQLNCAAVPEAMAESELFGHERGAFTDAKAARRGLVEIASGGTLFLDEIGELPLAIQAKLLTFLDGGRFRRLGGPAEQTSTARIVAATHRDLREEITRGRFREDLWFRLSVFRVDIPPLAQRREDIVPLAEAILDTLQGELGRKGNRLSASARTRLAAYDWPGNVRELRNLLERALVLEPGPELEVLGLEQPAARASADGFNIDDLLPMDEVERRYTKWVLARLGGRRMEAARALGLSYPTFLKRLEGGE
jgi:two-component system response regulator AtoC